MVDRLRALLDRPLDPSAGRAILVLATAIFLGFAAVFTITRGESEPGKHLGTAATPSQSVAVASPSPYFGAGNPRGDDSPPRRRPQDPQDNPGSGAARRAARALRAHRVLQHVPYRGGGLEIELVGARSGRAVLRVSAPSAPAARQGWHSFLRRHRDIGRAYVVLFRAARRSR